MFGNSCKVGQFTVYLMHASTHTHTHTHTHNNDNKHIPPPKQLSPSVPLNPAHLPLPPTGDQGTDWPARENPETVSTETQGREQGRQACCLQGGETGGVHSSQTGFTGFSVIVRLRDLGMARESDGRWHRAHHSHRVITLCVVLTPYSL